MISPLCETYKVIFNHAEIVWIGDGIFPTEKVVKERNKLAGDFNQIRDHFQSDKKVANYLMRLR